MKGRSGRCRLLGGRASRRHSPALLAVPLLILLIIIIAFFTSSHFLASPGGLGGSAGAGSREGVGAGEDVLRVASVRPTLVADVNVSSARGDVATYATLSNLGDGALTRVRVEAEGGMVLGILQSLLPGEKRTLAAWGDLHSLKVTAIDSSGSLITGDVRYSEPGSVPTPGTGRGIFAMGGAPKRKLKVQEAAPIQADPAATTAGAGQGSLPADKPSGIRISIETNRSEGHEGDVVGYRCTAENLGEKTLYDALLVCGSDKSTAKFLFAGKEIHIDGSLVLNKSTEISAGAQARDADDHIWTNNTTADVWMVSPKLQMEATSWPSAIHRGETVSLAVNLKNVGTANLSNVVISDSFGEIGRLESLAPGEAKTLRRDLLLDESALDEVRATAFDSDIEVAASAQVSLKVLNSGIDLSTEPERLTIYPGQPAAVTWVLNNTGEETLYDVTLSEGGSVKARLKEIAPAKAVRMAAIYNETESSEICITATGTDAGGYTVQDDAKVVIDVLSPGLSLKINPSKIEACPGESFDVSCLVTNSGDEPLESIVLYQGSRVLKPVGTLAPGEFRVVETKAMPISNCTIEFSAQGRDAKGQAWSDSFSVPVSVVKSALRVAATASPSAVLPGGTARITCTVTNRGGIPLEGVFVMSDAFGPLGVIDRLSPREEKVVVAEKTVDAAVSDTITVEGFTLSRASIRGNCSLDIPIRSSAAILEEDPSSALPMIAGIDGDGYDEVPEDEEITPATSGKKAAAAAGDIVASGTGRGVVEEVSGVLRYIMAMLGLVEVDLPEDLPEELPQEPFEEQAEEQPGGSSASGSAEVPATPEGAAAPNATRNYELSIESAEGADHGWIKILDVSAQPSNPPEGEPVKIRVHAESDTGVRSASISFGESDVPLTRQDMLEVKRVSSMPMTLEAGDERDGYWTCTVPGRAAGTYMAISVAMNDGSQAVEDGPYMIHWSTVSTIQGPVFPRPGETTVTDEGMLFIESSEVRGKGEVSIKDVFEDEQVRYKDNMKGYGSINFETLRTMDKDSPTANFTEKRDMVFAEGQIKGMRRLESPSFHGGMGASVTERYNLTHLDKSQVDMIRSMNASDNLISFNTEQAFNGTWNIQTQYSRLFKKIKNDQQYTGSFQTNKNIKFQDAGKS